MLTKQSKRNKFYKRSMYKYKKRGYAQCTREEMKAFHSIRVVGLGSWGGRVGKKEVVLREGERRQTLMCSFSWCTKLPVKIFSWNGPADPFTFMSNKSTPEQEDLQPKHNTLMPTYLYWNVYLFNYNMEAGKIAYQV